jgi:hypothetical protein
MDATQVLKEATNYGLLLVPEQNEMLPWLAQAARELRKAQSRKTVNIASSLDKSESTVSRFENAKGWPERPDEMIGAYADDLDMEAIDIWSHAVELWRAGSEPAITPEGADVPPPAPGGELGRRISKPDPSEQSPPRPATPQVPDERRRKTA